MNESKSQEVAKIILEQIGGRRFIVMTGSKNFLAMDNGLRMDLSKNNSGANRCEIILTAMDDYTVRFYKLNRTTLARAGRLNPIKEIAKHEGVYADQLQDIFTSVTGLFTNVGP